MQNFEVPGTPEELVVPAQQTERRVNSIDSAFKSLSDNPIVNFFKKLLAFGQRNVPRDSADDRVRQENEKMWTGGMSEAEFRAAVDRADNADPTTLAALMSNQPTMTSARMKTAAGQAGNVSGAAIMDSLAHNLNALAANDPTQARDPFAGAINNMMINLEPDAMRGYIFLRTVMRQEGMTLAIGTKAENLSTVFAVQKLYETDMEMRRSNSQPTATYDQWLREFVRDIRTERGTQVTIKDIETLWQRRTKTTVLSGLVTGMARGSQRRSA